MLFRELAIILFVLSIADLSLAQRHDSDASGEVIPAGRTISWKPGVSFRRGIPNRTSLINVKDAPYNAKGDGVSDDTKAIQAAINALQPNQMVYLPASIYLITNTLLVSNANTGITGDGPSKTIIEYKGANGGVDMIQVVPYQNYGSGISITSACNQGVNTITLDSASGVTVGDLLVISQRNPRYATDIGFNGTCGWCGAVNGSSNDHSRLMTQVDRVLSISGNRVTLERPLYLTFPASNKPRAQDLPTTYGIGVQHLQLRRNAPGITGGYMIEMQYVSESWIMDVVAICESNSETDSYFYFQNTYACEVRESWCQGIAPLHTGAGQGYGVYLVGPNSDALVEDNVFIACQIPNNIAGGGSGCVFGYNYCTQTVNSDHPWYMSADLDTHGGEPYMNLFEGCVGDGLSFDNTWGGNAFNTAYRCWLLAHGGEFQSNGHVIKNELAVDLQANTYSANIVGCVLGGPGITAYTDISYGSGVQRTSFVQGNFSFGAGKTLWISGPIVLPASLYYRSTPAWWTIGMPFPAIGPDLSPVNGTIPAADRYANHILDSRKQRNRTM